jgi:outer membrane protein W
MLQRTVTSVMLVFAAILTCARPAHAQQTVNFTLGYFHPLGHESRGPDDVLNINHSFLAFDLDEFGGASLGGEWLVGLGRFFEAGAGVSYTGQTVPSVYRDFIDSDGTEIDQDLELRMVPIAFTVRFLPFGQSSPLQPYVGGGLGIINWRYRETGEFVDFGAGRVIFEDTFEDSGNSTGAIFVGGVRFAGQRLTAGGEVRYQDAEGDLSRDFAGSKIDLGGWTYNFTIGVRF